MADTDMNLEMRKLREDFSALKHDVSDLLGEVRERGSERYEGLRESAAEGMRSSAEQLRRRVAAARLRGQEGVDDLGETIGSHPLQSVAMAFGLGFVLAKLMDGGRR